MSKLTPREWLFSHLIIDPSGCVLWTAAKNDMGYGHMTWHGREQYVHRIMYELFSEPIAAGLEIDHLCRVPPCAAPAHLEAVTHRVNQLRGRSATAVNAAKTHCPQGHEYDLLNTYFVPTTGWRQCRTCNKDRADSRKW